MRMLKVFGWVVGLILVAISGGTLFAPGAWDHSRDDLPGPVGQTYDYGGVPGSYKDAGDGPYTHYVDNADMGCTDSSNPYGGASTPRCTFPAASNIAPGAVIEVHEGPYSGSAFYFTASGTAEKPVFVRGPSTGPRPVISDRTFMIRAHHVIWENVEFVNVGVDIRPWYVSEEVHHVSIRHCESGARDGSLMAASSYVEGTLVHDIVFYDNHLHPDNFDPAGGEFPENDVAGVAIGRRSNRVWIVDNYIHHASGDAVGGGHAANYTASNYYIGRNVMHTCGENAIDIKEVENVVVSQNVMHDFQGWSSGSDGTAVVVHYGPTYSPKNVWILFNEIYDALDKGIQVGGSQRYDVYVIGNLIHDIHNPAGDGVGYATWNSEKVYFVGNVFYDLDNGIRHSTGAASAQLIFYDNIVANVSSTGYHMLVGDSVQRANADIDYNLFYQPGGDVRIDWGSQDYTVAQFQTATGKCEGCIEADPRFVDAANDDFHLQPGSPAIDAGAVSDLYQQFEDFFGLDIRFDYDGVSRPQGSGWDVGPYEHVPELVLRGAPGNAAIRLDWSVSITLPVTTTWHIDYYTQTASVFTTTEPLSVTRSAVLTEHVDNYNWYTVTLHAMDGATSWLSDTVRVMPTDKFVYLPLVMMASHSTPNPTHQGVATYYNATGAGACSFDPSPGDLMVAAMNAEEYDNAAVCGAYVFVTGPKGTVTVRIVDLCPGCGAGHLDLSREAFAKIADLPQGLVPITWRVVSPVLTGPIAYHFKDGSNQWWTAVQIRNHRNPVAKLEYRNGSDQWITVPRTSYNYFVQTNPGMGPGPHTFRVTDAYGNTLTDTGIPHVENGTVNGAAQFPPGP